MKWYLSKKAEVRSALRSGEVGHLEEEQYDSAHGARDCRFLARRGGWGAITAPDLPGVGFVHFSNVTGIAGYRNLVPGTSVEFEWLDDLKQDGCQWRAAWVRPHVTT